jgi:predicted TIM-barrel enzyme
VTAEIFAQAPLVIAALHLPDPVAAGKRSAAWLEDYVLANARVFAEAGVPAVKLQDQTREPGAARVETVARMAALGRMIRAEFPALHLGIILQAHDAEAPIAVAEACGACFVRLKVFVASVVGAEGPKHALAIPARAYRAALPAPGVAILADVFDRTTVPLAPIEPERAALWAEGLGADGLVLTGADFADSLARIGAARAAGVRVPILPGGGVTEDNVAQALGAAQGVVVSSSLMRRGIAARGGALGRGPHAPADGPRPGDGGRLSPAFVTPTSARPAPRWSRLADEGPRLLDLRPRRVGTFREPDQVLVVPARRVAVAGQLGRAGRAIDRAEAVGLGLLDRLELAPGLRMAPHRQQHLGKLFPRREERAGRDRVLLGAPLAVRRLAQQGEAGLALAPCEGHPALGGDAQDSTCSCQ